MTNMFSKFTKCYQPTSKTLRFTLIPQGKTQQNIDTLGVLAHDTVRAEAYATVKGVLDKYHKHFLEDALSTFNISWEALFDAYDGYRKNKDEEALNSVRNKYVAEISRYLTSKSNEVDLKPEKIIKRVLSGEFVVEQAEMEAVKSFDKFATYFEGYKENRNNIYGEKQNSVAYRLVYENFPRFFSNCQKYKEVKDLLLADGVLVDADTQQRYFTASSFGSFVTQTGIDAYNVFIGGFTMADGTKVQGINELCNLAYQQNKLSRKVVFDVLYKQILSDRQSLSFVDLAYQSDDQLLQELKLSLENVATYLNQHLQQMLDDVCSNYVDASKVWVDKKQISTLSTLLFGDWSLLESKLGKKAKYTLEQVQQCCTGLSVMQKFVERFGEEYQQFVACYNAVCPVLQCNTISSYVEIKACLDSLKSLEKLLKIFATSAQDEKDDQFYVTFDEIYNQLVGVSPVYNRVRNYATKKEYSEEKYKINFNIPKLGGGWDKNKENDYKSILLMRHGNYYLGIFNKDKKVKIVENAQKGAESDYQKMVYKLLPGPNKMLPKVFFSKKGLATFGVSDEILDGYTKGKHKKGANFDLDFCHQLINFFKDAISKHPDWKNFNFQFSPTESYQDISQFYSEISQQAYKVSFTFVSQEDVNALVDEGKLMLFQIYNKDFSEKSTGNKNLHTMYWENLFTPQNLQKPVFQLNGGAELFYRPASISNPFVHKQGSVLVNKIDKEGKFVDEEIYKNATDDAETMPIEQLQATYPNIKFRLAPHDIVKNKRFTTAQYKFHCPISFNYDAQESANQKQFNQRVAQHLAMQQNVRVIGIDRGERHLLYYSVVDKNGIIEQGSLNVVNGTNYHDKLVAVAQRRDQQRKNWTEIENIKELKQGYLSAVVSEICKLMVKHNAIVVLENLNYGFKNSRKHIEQQAYQNFEIALLKKLNYLVFKDVDAYAPGGVANAYQLSAKYESFDRVGTQSGFVFYVPASYTSKIDPTTGFVNLFGSPKYESVTKAQEFFGKFRSITYSQQHGFEFAFKYGDFEQAKGDGDNTLWTVSTGNALRTIFVPNRLTGGGSYSDVDVTSEMLTLMQSAGINLQQDIKESIVANTTKAFWEKMLWLFKVTVQMRYSSKDQDYILSPVLKDGKRFDSRTAPKTLPCDGDANGAYHIALKGLRLVTQQIDGNGSIVLDKKGQQNKAWFAFAQQQANKN